jgi:hypothetical protein
LPMVNAGLIDARRALRASRLRFQDTG